MPARKFFCQSTSFDVVAHGWARVPVLRGVATLEMVSVQDGFRKPAVAQLPGGLLPGILSRP